MWAQDIVKVTQKFKVSKNTDTKYKLKWQNKIEKNQLNKSLCIHAYFPKSFENGINERLNFLYYFKPQRIQIFITIYYYTITSAYIM